MSETIPSSPRTENNPLHQQLASIRQSLFDEGHLNNQFVQLESMEDNDEANFVEEVAGVYFRDSTKLFVTVEQALEETPVDFVMLDKYVHRFKGSSSSIGATKVLMGSIQMRDYLDEGAVENCKAILQQMKKDYEILRNKLQTYFQLRRQVGSSETAERPN